MSFDQRGQFVGAAVLLAKSSFPVLEGYYNHTADMMEVEQRLIDQVLE